ncbi:MAG: hypothetical protein HBSAPP03_29350 [Phycisphaerae bacterium]|nr:MAG: hypothetical protein HBSAPP03_29350 [Phycisphaerae bacterium]
MMIRPAQIGDIARPIEREATLTARADGDRALFADALAKAQGTGAAPAAAAREAAGQLVAASLIMPVLKGLRESNQAAAPFAPGAGEKAFRGMMDDMMAQRLVQRADWGLVDAVARRVMQRAGVEATA